MAAQVAVLGPLRADAAISIAAYFDVLSAELPKVKADIHVRAYSPDPPTPTSPLPSRVISRAHAWRANYIRWPLTLLRIRADLCHIVDQGLAWYAPFVRSTGIIITVHDLIAYLTVQRKLDLPLPPSRRRHLVRECIRQVRRARHLICVSEHTAHCVMSELDVPSSKITVVHNYIDPIFRPLLESERTALRAKWFGTAGAAILHVGSAAPYKNRLAVLRSFRLVRERVADAALFLVHGPPTIAERHLLATELAGAPVCYLPRLTWTELAELYAAADVFVFPSIYEGFGWPPVEAMASGCPVVCTNTSSLREVVGTAAITVADPQDYAALAAATARVLLDPAVAQNLRQRGLQRAQAFNIQDTIAEIARVYDFVLR